MPRLPVPDVSVTLGAKIVVVPLASSCDMEPLVPVAVKTMEEFCEVFAVMVAPLAIDSVPAAVRLKVPTAWLALLSVTLPAVVPFVVPATNALPPADTVRRAPLEDPLLMPMALLVDMPTFPLEVRLRFGAIKVSPADAWDMLESALNVIEPVLAVVAFT